MKTNYDELFAEYDREQQIKNIVNITRMKTLKVIINRPVRTSVLKAASIKVLTKLCREYFKREVQIANDGMLNVGSIGIVYGFTVERKRKYYHLIKTGNK